MINGLFAENEYYMLLLVDEMKQKYEDITTCFDLFSKLKHEDKRIWVNLRDRRGGLDNSYFVADDKLTDACWNLYIVIGCRQSGFYQQYYIVDCMNVIRYQRWRIECSLVSTQFEKLRQEKKKAAEMKKLYGKQYNMFGGMD